MDFPLLELIAMQKNPFKKVCLSDLPNLKLFANYEIFVKHYEEISLSNLICLKKINLRSAKVTKLALKDLPSLTKLILDENLLTSLEISDLPALEQLSLNYN